MPTPATLLWGIVFGAIGVGYVIYGKRATMLAPMLCGVALMVYPWFVSGALLTVIVGLVLMAIPWFVRW